MTDIIVRFTATNTARAGAKYKPPNNQKHADYTNSSEASAVAHSKVCLCTLDHIWRGNFKY